MKNLTSNTEGVWIEIKPITFTEEQKTILKSSNTEEKTALIAELKEESETKPDKVTLALAVAQYNYIKSMVSKDETYEFIQCSLTLTDKVKGILNCRVNGEHKQIRF